MKFPKMRVEIIWRPATLPGCLGWPCEVAVYEGRTAYVWQASKETARGVWCWRLDGGGNHVVDGNRGTAKTAAARALLRASRPT